MNAISESEPLGDSTPGLPRLQWGSVRQAFPRGALALILLAGVAGLEWGCRSLVAHDLVASKEATATGKPVTARRHLQRANRLAPSALEPRLALAELEFQLGNFTVAEPMLEGLLDENLTISLHARALTAAAQVSFSRGHYASASQRSRQALAVAVASGQPELEAHALLADSAIRVEENADARPIVAALERARRLAIEIDDDRLRARAETEIGYVRWWYLREIDDPVPEYYDPALEVFQHTGDSLGAARVLDRTSLALLRADDLIAFFEAQERALKIWESAGNRARQAEGHLLIGWAWSRLENPRRAHHHLEQALMLAQETGFDLLVRHIQWQLAGVEHASGRSERAIARLERLIAKPRPWDGEGRSIFAVLGDAHRRLGEFAAARNAYEQALELDRAKDVSFRVWVGQGLARTALSQGNVPRARQLLSELEGLVDPRSDWSDRRRVLLLRARVLEAESGPSSALAPLLEAAEFETRSLGSVGGLTVDHGLGVLRRLLPRLLDSDQLDSNQGAEQPKHTSSASDPPDLWAATAFRLLEQARLRPVRQRVLLRLGRKPAEEAEAARESAALRAARELSALAAANGSPEMLTRLPEAYARYEEEVFRARSVGGLFKGGRAATVAEIQQRLPSSSSIVVYVLTRRIAVALVLRSDRFEVVPLGIQPADLRPRIKVLRHQLAARRGSGWRAPAHELGRLLITPIEASGGLEGTERLLVVPMGELHEVPFAALLDGAGTPLIEKMAITMLPAASALLDSTPRNGGNTVVLGRESFHELGLPNLPAARREVQAVARLSNATEVFDSELSERAFRKLAVNASRLHIVTHARVEPEMPLLSRLILAPPENTGESSSDGELTVRELLDFELQAELVTLSACRSGLALPATRRLKVELRRTGLVDGFLLAGAHNVLGTLFPVEDEATTTFMVALEEELRQHQPIDALAAVQRVLSAGDGQAAHPGHWAAFVLAGPGTWSAGRVGTSEEAGTGCSEARRRGPTQGCADDGG